MLAGVAGSVYHNRHGRKSRLEDFMDQYHLYWGDLHTHFEDIENGDAILRDARQNIDFCAVLCYPFVWERKNGLRLESVRQRPEFLQWWKKLKELNRAHYDPGAFTTFLAYEWHGNRTRYGDHNVIYLEEDGPLDDSWELAQLYANLRQCQALALPHHTGYAPQWRSKDWEVYDEKLSPLMEVFSGHGSSEGVDAAFPMESNGSMGPRTTGGTLQDALARGYRIGVIGSNDGPGLPGRWGAGRAAVWATACTREGLWEALKARRTYAVSGDRMELEFSIEEAAMGSQTRAGSAVDVEVAVTGSHAIDRIELLHNGYVQDTYCHSGCWERQAREQARFKVFIEAGWGPALHYGFKESGNHPWTCRLDLTGGELVGVEPCFSMLGQRVVSRAKDHCAWKLFTAFRTVNRARTEGVVVELAGTSETRLRLNMDGVEIDLSIGDLLDRSLLVPLVEESRQRVEDIFGLESGEVHNVDAYYHNARKIKVHRAIPQSGYRVAHTFRNIGLEQGRHYFYVRASQLNGQMAWSSPIWVDVE